MPHTVRGKKALLMRIRRIKGQTEALERALDEEVECSAILQQIAAIRGATDGLMAEVMEGHLRDHVAGPTSAKQRQKDLDAVLRVLRSYLR
jgi:DNA-binding FrmR family transcriptional regulator